ncbi:hypothetical protein AYI77_20670 [Shewanella algae]|nr:hypothetical protein AYI77_21065 [Shewanella algae]PST65155.1 hypothetical protein AYI77_20670 [Shewanella algae]TVO87627.1 hypothetical protein AYI80_14175 [Shewanella algae]TXS84956.1 hypothetical protein AYI81_16745 [Shewanella algae]
MNILFNGFIAFCILLQLAQMLVGLSEFGAYLTSHNESKAPLTAPANEYPLATINPLYPLTGTECKIPTGTGTVNGYGSITQFGARYLTGVGTSVPIWPYPAFPDSAHQLNEVQP